MSLDFNPLEFFKEEIRNETAAIKIVAVQRLDLIASAMGNQKTTNELIPFLIQIMQEEPYCNDEEFLFSLAKQFAMLAEYVNNTEILIAPLEHLASQEETVIRDQAVMSLCIIVEKRTGLVPEYLVPTLKRLSTKTDFFTARVSACSLFPATYRYANEDQKSDLRKQYATICQDDTPMVRRAAAHKMKDLFAVCTKTDVLDDLIQVYKMLSAEDTQDTIRVACVHATLVLAELFSKEENLAHTIEVIKDASQDRSWRVRLTIASKFPALCKAFGSDITLSHLMQCFVSLVKDQEHEVRKEAVRMIEHCLKDWSVEVTKEYIIPHFSTVVVDSMQQVRAALALVIGPVAKTVGRDVTQRLLLPIISDLMKDEYHDVRLNIVAQSGTICEVLGVDGLIHSLLHSIQSLIMDNHWRIRKCVVEQVPTLAKLFGVEMYQSKLEALFLSSLRDSVYAVRHAAIDNIKQIAELFGGQWTVDRLMNKVMDQYSQSAGYANRVTTLQVLPNLAMVMSPEYVAQLLLPIISKALKDAVPNVRFCALKMLCAMMEQQARIIPLTNDIKPSIVELQQDSDVDVQYYASQVAKLGNWK